MAISVGDRLPDVTFHVMGADGPEPKTTADIFKGRKVALFAVPGAYTPTCHKQHMPGFVSRIDDIKSRGVDAVACTSVNDIFVLQAWAEDSDAKGKIEMLADGNANFAKALGLDLDLSKFGLNTRSARYSMLVDDGVVKSLNVDDAPPVHDKSSAETLCSLLPDPV